MLSDRDRRLLDMILAAWIVLWIVAGVLVWHEVRGLRPLAGTVAVAGRSLDDTAAALRGFSGVPLVGPSLRRVANDAAATAASARQSARDGRQSVDRLAVILGIAVPAVAILPLALAYALIRPRR
ncbi:MAG TPA: hypothetical protein VFA97_02475 [Gaiellaceae bacterium]|nr:hypothetical protein [Gaiellaceae bacterium]